MTDITPQAEPAKPMDRRRLVALRVTSTILVLILMIVISEIACMFVGFIKFDRLTVMDLYDRELGNTFAVTENRDDYSQTLAPHPYLAFVHKEDAPGVNNIGLYGHDYPLEKDDSKFVILLTGGSVASMFCRLDDNGQSALERILNERYRTDREFVVLNGGDGAWHQPQQFILFSQYAHVVDGVITLDGFNERYTQGPVQKRLEYPASNFSLVNPLVSEGGFDNVAAIWMLSKFRKGARSNFILRHSHTTWFIAHLYRLWVYDSIAAEKKESDGLYAIPEDWDSDKRFDYNMARYRDYIRYMHAIAVEKGVQDSYFVQPVPAIGKTLTPAEAGDAGDLSYAPTYRKMVDSLLELQDEDIPIHSLLHVFDDVEERLYRDDVHFDQAGNEIMAEAIAAQIAEDWGLVAR